MGPRPASSCLGRETTAGGPRDRNPGDPRGPQVQHGCGAAHCTALLSFAPADRDCAAEAAVQLVLVFGVIMAVYLLPLRDSRGTDSGCGLVLTELHMRMRMCMCRAGRSSPPKFRLRSVAAARENTVPFPATDSLNRPPAPLSCDKQRRYCRLLAFSGVVLHASSRPLRARISRRERPARSSMSCGRCRRR